MRHFNYFYSYHSSLSDIFLISIFSYLFFNYRLPTRLPKLPCIRCCLYLLRQIALRQQSASGALLSLITQKERARFLVVNFRLVSLFLSAFQSKLSSKNK